MNLEDTSLGKTSLTLQQVIGAKQAYKRRLLWHMFGGLLGLLICGILSLVMLKSGVPVIWEPSRPVLAIALLAVGYTCLIVAMALCISTREMASLNCPHCRKTFDRGTELVIATGNCPHCGRRVIKDEKHGT